MLLTVTYHCTDGLKNNIRKDS